MSPKLLLLVVVLTLLAILQSCAFWTLRCRYCGRCLGPMTTWSFLGILFNIFTRCDCRRR